MQINIKNIFFNMGGFASSLVVAFFLSPFIVHGLGDEVYGIWTLVISFTGSFGLFDLGIKSAMGQYTTRYMAQGDVGGVNRTMSTAFLVMSGVGVIGVLATLTLMMLLPKWVSLNASQLSQARIAMCITGFSVAASFPLAIFSSITYSLSRFDIQSGITVFDRLLSALLTVAALSSGTGIVGLASVTAFCLLLSSMIRVFFAYRLYPSLSIRIKNTSRQSALEMGGYGGKSFLITATERIVTYADAVIIGCFMTTAAITRYSIAANLIPYYMGLVASIAWTLAPVATASDATGETKSLQSLFLNGTRGLAAFSALIGVGLILLGKDFIALWMGEEYVRSNGYDSSATVLYVLAIAAFLRSYSSAGRQVLFAMRKLRVQVLIAAFEGAMNLGLSICFVRKFGLIGVALGTLLPLLITQTYILPKYILGVLEVPWRTYMRQILLGIVPLTVVMTSVDFLTKSIIVKTWPVFLCKVSILTAAASIAIWVCVLSRPEKMKLKQRAGWRPYPLSL